MSYTEKPESQQISFSLHIYWYIKTKQTETADLKSWLR